MMRPRDDFMTAHWTLDDIEWGRLDRNRITPELLAVIKAASLIEANADDYVAYLSGVFSDDPAFVAATRQWGIEEEQHGAALGRWAELADPHFSFAEALAAFRRLYKVPVDSTQSVRGSLTGELIARQVVETGTSSFYSAIRDATDEPVLKDIAGRIASDEFRHYRLFAQFAQRYQRERPLGLFGRIRVALTRFREADDDELGCAYFAANVLPREPRADYRAHDYGREYWRRAMTLYRRRHVEDAVRMILRAAGLGPNGLLFRLGSSLFWRTLQGWRARLASAAA